MSEPMQDTIVCPRCDGAGKTVASHVSYASGRHGYNVPLKCNLCDGTGTITAERAEWVRIGNELQERRVASRQTLRDVANLMVISPAVVSGMEWGRYDPAPLVRYWTGAAL